MQKIVLSLIVYALPLAVRCADRAEVAVVRHNATMPAVYLVRDVTTDIRYQRNTALNHFHEVLKQYKQKWYEQHCQWYDYQVSGVFSRLKIQSAANNDRLSDFEYHVDLEGQTFANSAEREAEIDRQLSMQKKAFDQLRQDVDDVREQLAADSQASLSAITKGSYVQAHGFPYRGIVDIFEKDYSLWGKHCTLPRLNTHAPAPNEDMHKIACAIIMRTATQRNSYRNCTDTQLHDGLTWIINTLMDGKVLKQDMKATTDTYMAPRVSSLRRLVLKKYLQAPLEQALAHQPLLTIDQAIDTNHKLKAIPFSIRSPLFE